MLGRISAKRAGELLRSMGKNKKTLPRSSDVEATAVRVGVVVFGLAGGVVGLCLPMIPCKVIPAQSEGARKAQVGAAAAASFCLLSPGMNVGGEIGEKVGRYVGKNWHRIAPALPAVRTAVAVAFCARELYHIVK